jgi:quercetin dioxygenase-like cupin family protein
MELKIRRVVTGHDTQGNAIVKIDEVASNVTSGRPGAESLVVWTTRGFPVSNDGDTDDSLADVGTSETDGTVFRVVRYAPGVAARNHRTESIDYAVVISGEIDMALDNGVEVHLKAGDVVVQRGTIHNWINRGKEPCVIGFSLIGAHPVTKGGKTLKAIG